MGFGGGSVMKLVEDENIYIFMDEVLFYFFHYFILINGME